MTNPAGKKTGWKWEPSGKNPARFLMFCIWWAFLSVDRLSLQSGKVRSANLERIFPSINFSSEFSRIHARETQQSFDPTKAKCCKLVQQRGKTRSSTFQALSFLRYFQKRDIWKTMHRQTMCCKLSRSTDRNDPEVIKSEIQQQSVWVHDFEIRRNSAAR